MCDCISYNRPDSCPSNGRPEVILPTPPHIAAIMPSGKPNGICVDTCIADVILVLWAKKIETLGCCCGHNQDNPNVVISESQDAQRVKEILANCDRRQWDVMQWRLVKC